MAPLRCSRASQHPRPRSPEVPRIRSGVDPIGLHAHNGAMDLGAYAAAWRLRTEAEHAARQRAAEQMRARVSLAAVMLRERWGVRRVLLFGSLAHGTWSPGVSDVDLAVEGLPDEALLPALGAVLGVIRCPVDLVRLEEAAPSLREAIVATGEEVG